MNAQHYVINYIAGLLDFLTTDDDLTKRSWLDSDIIKTGSGYARLACRAGAVYVCSDGAPLNASSVFGSARS